MTRSSLPPVSVTVLSTADYNAPLWTNKQYLATFLAQRLPTFYVESLGLRRPTLGRKDAARALGRLRTHGDNRLHPDGLTIIKPIVMPLHDWKVARSFNTRMLRSQLERRGATDASSTLWTFSPLTYGLEEIYDTVVYHSVDLLHALPRLNSDILLRAEDKLLGKAHKVIASSSKVADHLGRHRDDVLLWPNVADLGVFGTQRAHRRPAAVFGGHLTPTKIDLDILQTVVDADIELHLAGPLSLDGTQPPPGLSSLLQHSGVTYHGTLSTSKLAELYEQCSVGLVPYVSNPYTSGVLPMKTYEYMACGLTVVASGLPSLQAVVQVRPSEDIIVVTDARQFASTVKGVLNHTSGRDITRRREHAQQHSWSARMSQVDELLHLPEALAT